MVEGVIIAVAIVCELELRFYSRLAFSVGGKARIPLERSNDCWEEYSARMIIQLILAVKEILL